MQKSELKDLIAQDKIKTLIKRLEEIALSQDDDWQDQLALVVSRYHRQKNRSRAGLDEHEHQMVGIAQINDAFIGLLDGLPEEIKAPKAGISKDLVKWIVGVVGLVVLVFVVAKLSGIIGKSERGDVVIIDDSDNNRVQVKNKDNWEGLPLDSLHQKDSLHSQD